MLMGYDLFYGFMKLMFTALPFIACGLVAITLIVFRPSRKLINKWFYLDS